MIAKKRVTAFVIIIAVISSHCDGTVSQVHNTDGCALTLHGDVYQSLMLKIESKT